jgi:sulfoxide reductase heme-binding subunit YedZ
MHPKIKFNREKFFLNILAFLPLGWLVFGWFSHRLGANPVQKAQQFSGDTALILLMITLAVTPIRNITGLTSIGKYRKTLGLQTFYYALIHLLIFLWLDYGFFWKEIFSLFLEKRFLWAGLPAFTILLVLAVTSIKAIKRVLGNWWKRIHRLVYAAGILATLHYALSVKGSPFLVRGAVVKPLIAVGIVVLLLFLRLPFLKNLVSQHREGSPDQESMKDYWL